MTDARQIVLGTYNQKKRDELQRLLAPLAVELRTLKDFPEAIEVVEDGTSFGENATKKASQQAVHLGQWVLAEDSACVSTRWKGAPGIYSARFSGEEATDESNNDLLLENWPMFPMRNAARITSAISRSVILPAASSSRSKTNATAASRTNVAARMALATIPCSSSENTT